MQRKRKGKEIIGTPIKEYKLPLFERIAYYRPFLKFLLSAAIAAAVVGPTIVANYENFWYFILIAPVIVFFVLGIIHLIEFIYFQNRCNAKIRETVENDHHADIYAGAPGTGKTFTAEFLQHEKAKYNWEELQFEYWCIAPKLKKTDYKPSNDEQEIIESYKFYIENDGVPCWSSNIPAYSKHFKRYAYDVDGKYLKQEERAAYRLCSVMDELGTVATIEMKDQRKSNEGGAADMTDTFKFCRHFNLWSICGCEQDQNNVYKDARRVVAENRVYTSRKWVLRPIFWLWLYEKLKRHFIKNMYFSEAVVFSKFMLLLKRYTNACGFFKFSYKIRSNTETGANVVLIDSNDKDSVYIPRANEVVYRTRAFREAYKAKNKPICMKSWDSLYMSVSRARSMLKSENLPKAKNTSEKTAPPKDILSF